MQVLNYIISTAVGIKTDNNNNRKIDLPEKIHDIDIAAGYIPEGSIQVNMAWIVNENDLDNMYLNLNGDGAAFEFSESMLDVGLVDIRQ